MTWRSNPRAWAVISIVLMAFLSPSSAKVIYVDANAPGPTHDGSNWTNAYKYLQDALTDASSSPKPVEILVAQGIYKPDRNTANPEGTRDRNASFLLLNDVAIKGGYAGYDQTDPNARDFELYESILSGDLDGNDVKVDPCELLNEPTRAENSYHVVKSPYRRQTAVLDGFTITGGNANGPYYIDGGSGGGIYNTGQGGLFGDAGSPTIINCTLTANSARFLGGGMCNHAGNTHCTPTAIKCKFMGNYAGTAGGGMYNFSGSQGVCNPSLIDCKFIDNLSGSDGGGLYSHHSGSLLNNCEFTHNSAVINGGGTHICGPNSVMKNCLFSGNTAESGGGIYAYDNCIASLTNCTLAGNEATNGCTLVTDSYEHNYPSNIQVTNCILINDGNEIHNNDNSTIEITFSNILGGWPGLGNIDTDPCFADANNADYHLKSQAGRWDPNSESWVMDYVSSPCIDSANPGCPVGDEPAPNGNRKNMGAYGGTAEAGMSPGNGRNIADLTNDWAIDYNDIKVFVSYWLEAGDCIPGDFDRSKFVDFNDYGIFALQWLHKKDSVAIFIDSNTHSDLTNEIQRLKSDIINDLGVNVFIFSDNWDDIEEIKDIIIDKYNHAGLIGAIFIGQIPTAYFEYQNSGSVPTDRYFQDLSDKFIDVDGDGKFEREYYMAETDVTMREIWTGRIKPPVGRSEGIVLLRDYLDRNHNYRTTNLSYDKKMLYYGSISINQDGMSQDDYNDLVNQIDDYTGLYESDDEVDSIYDPNLEMQKRNYLTALKNSYDFVFVNIHGTVWHQWLGENSPGDQCVVYYNEIKEFRPQSLFSVLASCSNGDFTTENYFAGWFLFSGGSLVVQANTTVSMLTGANTMEFLKDYIPLGLGVTFGDMDKNNQSFIVTHIFGDPTLTLRPKPAGDLPHLSRYESELDFGDVERGTIPRQYISFWNGGSAILKITYKKPCYSINGEHPNLGYWDFFYYEHPTTGETFRDFEIRPGKCKVVPFYFYPRADGPIGRYTMTILFQTNDPENPYLEIHLSGNAI
jgi:predicted outer membrane repeat protein